MNAITPITETQTFSHVSGFFGGDSPTYWSYSFADWNFASAGDTGFDWSWGNQDDDWFTAAVSFDAFYDMAFGITGEARVDLGSMESEIAVNSNAAIVNGGVSTADAAIDTTLTVTGPDPEQTYLDIDLIARFNAGMKASATFWAYGYGEEYFDLFDLGGGFDLSGDLINVSLQDVIDSLDARKMLELDLGFGALQFGLPTFTFDEPVAVDGGPLGAVVVTGASETFLNVEVDLDSFLSIPVGFEYDDSFLGIIFPTIDVGLFDAKLNVGLNFEQEITFTPTTSVTMVSEGGETLSGGLGDDFLFEEGKKEGEGSFTVTATYDTDTHVSMITSLATGATVDWRLFYATVQLAVDIPAIWDNLDDPFGFDFELASGSIDLGLDFSFEIDTTEWTIDGEIWTETFTVTYENDRTVASGRHFELTTNQEIGRGNARGNEITGNKHGNTLIGGRGDDTLHGGSGGDKLRGDEGNDHLDGGNGSDTAMYNTSTAGVVVNLADTSRNRGDAAGDVYTSIENVKGSDFDDVLIGNSGKNRLLGGDGVDYLEGGDGDDVYDWNYYYGPAAGDTLVEHAGGGTDTVIMFEMYAQDLWENFENIRVHESVADHRYFAGNGANNVIIGNDNGQSIAGRDGDDTLEGRGGVDHLRGEAGNDSLVGDDGGDQLYGGSGADTLVGGAGADVFDFEDWQGSTPSEMDVITDFTGSAQGDVILLSISDFNYFLGSDAFTFSAGQIRSVVDGADSLLQGDTNGDGVADFQVRLQNYGQLYLDNFFFVA